eukprot:gene10058-8210_t
MPECLYEVEWGGFLTNHLSHGRWAMAQIGTPEALQQRYTELYKTRLTALATSQQRPQSPTLVLTEAEVGALRGTRQRYADQRAFFAEEIQNKGGVNPTLLHYLPQLLRGLAGAALYCPKYKVAFYLETPATYKFIATFMPLLFVVLLAVLNVMNGQGEGPEVENSIALCLTCVMLTACPINVLGFIDSKVVFILPELRPPGRGDTSKGLASYMFSNNASIFLLFIGLCFTSFAHPKFYDEARAEDADAAEAYIAFFDTDGDGKYGYAEFIGMIGIICLVVSLFIPAANFIRYKMDKSFTKWDIESKASDETVKQEPMLDVDSVSNLNKMCAVSALKDGELDKTDAGDESESIKEKRFKEAGRSSSFQKVNYIVDEKKTVWVCKEEKPKKGKLGKKILTCGPSHK